MPTPVQNSYTLLDIDGIDLGLYSVRDLGMTLEPISQAFQQARNINGLLIDISQSQFHNKYRVTIACNDHESPIFAGVLPGTIVTVTCIPHLGLGANSDEEPEQMVLEMMVQPWSVGRREYEGRTAWQLQLESI